MFGKAPSNESKPKRKCPREWTKIGIWATWKCLRSGHLTIKTAWTKRQKFSQSTLNHSLFQFEDAVDDPKKLLDIAKEKQKDGKNEPVERLTNLVRDGIKLGQFVVVFDVANLNLGYRLAEKNMTSEELDEKTMKLISPRFLSVVPDNDTDTVSYFRNLRRFLNVEYV